MRICVPIALFSIASSASADTDQIIRYEVGIRVTENHVASNGLGGDLALLDVGTEGVFMFDVNPSDEVFPVIGPGFGTVQTYQVLDVGIEVGVVTASGREDSYPSTDPTFGSFIIENDAVIFSGSTISDSVGMSFTLDHPEIGFAGLTMAQRLPVSAGVTPELLDSLDAPLDLDLSLLTSSSFSLFSTRPGPSSNVRFEFTSVSVTVIPAAPSASLLLFSGMLAARRRR